jgi:uncharacterized protein
MRHPFTLAFFALLAICTCVRPMAAAEEQPRIISTNGEAVVNVVPDKVVINFGVQNTDANLDKARAANDEQSARLVRAFKAAGIAEKDIQTDTMNVSILYIDGRRLTIEGYQASRTYSITLRDIKKFEATVDTGLKNGANLFQGFTYESTDLRKYRDQARAMAIKAAAEKARDLAEVLKCTIGAPRTISESSGGASYYGGRSGYNSYLNAQNSVQSVGDATGTDGETMPLGQIAIRANVAVTFDLVPPK